MKLRHKKTGEITDLTEGFIKDVGGAKIVLAPVAVGYKTYEYYSLAELNEEWEDYTKPEKYWYIDARGSIIEDADEGTPTDSTLKELGNYFLSKEEAEQTVEKIKAWKRLKDAGFEFEGWRSGCGEYPDYVPIKTFGCNIDDLDLIFGVENE